MTSNHIWPFLSDLFRPDQIHLQICHISSTEHEARCLWPLFSEPVLWVTWLQCIAMISPVPKDPHDRGSSFDAVGQEAGRDDAVQLGDECGPSRDPCSESLTVWHSTSSSIATPPLAQTPRSVSLPHKLTHLSQLTGMHLSCAQHARHSLVAHCTEVCWRKGHWVICTLVPPDMALDPFSHNFPTSEKPSCFSLTASTTWCPASLLDTSSSCAKFTAVSFLFSAYFQGERGRVTPIICILFIFWFLFYVESLITSGKSSEQRRVGSAFH